MITLQNVSFGYNRRKKVFSDLSLSLDHGHIHGLLGCNGIGKSTLLHLICGLLTPDTGEISVDGFRPGQRLPQMLSNLLLLPEEVSLPDVAFRRMATVTGAFYPNYSPEMFAEHCAALQVDPALTPRSMSMGTRKKAYIALALACNTEMLLLDEPTNGLDIPSKTTLRRLLAAYADDKRTVVISTHQIREVENLIDNVVILDEQGLALAATTEQLSRRLTFGPLSMGTKVIYSEPALTGAEGISVNTSGRESRPDLEMLFAAVAHDRSAIPAILTAKTHRHE